MTSDVMAGHLRSRIRDPDPIFYRYDSTRRIAGR